MCQRTYFTFTEEENRRQVKLSELNKILLQSGNGQSFDLIWGPDLDISKETYIDVKALNEIKDTTGAP